MKSKVTHSILDTIEIASPCTVSWENMEGDACIRHCGQCQLSVYNISEMPKEQAEKLIQEHEGRLCVRLYRRFDGTVITNDCPIGLRRLRQIVKITVRAAATVLSFFLSLSTVQANDNNAVKDKKSDSSQSQVFNKTDQASSNTINNKNPINTSNGKVHPLMGRFVPAKPKNGPALNGAPMTGSICPVKTTVIDKSEKKPANEQK